MGRLSKSQVTLLPVFGIIPGTGRSINLRKGKEVNPMDPVTISSLLAAAAGALGSEAVKDLYEAAKQRIKDVFGQEEDLLEALEDVEAKPQSGLKQKTLQGQLENVDISQNQELLEILAKLEPLLRKKGLYSSTTYSGTQRGSGGMAQGKKNLVAGKGGVVGKKIKKAQVNTGKKGKNIKTKMYIEHATLVESSPDSDKKNKAKQRYLQRKVNAFQVLPLAAMGGGDELMGEVTLDQVYIDLDTETPRVDPAAAEPKGRERLRQEEPHSLGKDVYTVLEISKQTKKILLLGGPGSGKSTFAKELCVKMANAQLNNTQALKGWERQLLPLFLVLRHVVPELSKLDLTSCSSEQQDQRLTDVLYQAWCKQFGQDQETAVDILEESLLPGNVLLVFDGVDEVPVEQRPRVYQAVMAILARYPKIKHTIITCRSRSYTGPEMLPGFVPHHLAPFNEDKIRQFVRAWYAAQPELDAGSRETRIQDLQAVALGPLAELSPNPMLLTTMSVLHRKGAGLPKERVKLYDLAVNVMLQRWEKDRDTAESQAIRAVLEDERRLREVLEHIGHFVHETEGGQESREGLDRYRLLKELENPKILGSLALPFLNYVDQRAGLLSGEGGGEGGIPQTYRFPHRTFQEYLAGCYMVKGRRIQQAYRKRAGEGDYWSVAAQLGVEELFFNRRNDEVLLDLAYELCPESEPMGEDQWRINLWAGMVAVLLGGEPFEADEEHPRGGTTFLETLKRRLQQLMQKSPLPPIERAEAGRHLAKLGDSRFRSDAWSLPNEPLLGFVEIPAGPFQMGQTGKTINIEIPYTYYMSRYPVTQGQFQAFVEDGGYQKASFWPEAKAAGIWEAGTVKGQFDEEPRHQPEKFSETFGLHNHPVVEITWYEALAYCRWLTQKLRGWNDMPEPLKTLLDTGGESGKPWSIVLPNEPEWEKASRGAKDDRTYPWDEEADPNRANYDETQINATSAVGCFPQGKSPYGVEELSGNVWEWTRSIYENEPYPQAHKAWSTREDLTAGTNRLRVLRGGSWIYGAHGVRCAFRLWYGPGGRGGVGFRVVASPFSSR